MKATKIIALLLAFAFPAFAQPLGEGVTANTAGVVNNPANFAAANAGALFAAAGVSAITNSSPGVSKYWGTDGSGTRGYFTLPSSGGNGDMLRSTYDSNTDGVVDLAAAVAWSAITGKPSTFTPSSHTHPASEISDATAVGRALLTAADAAAQRSALGLGGAALLSVGTSAGTVAAGNDSRITGAVQSSDVAGLTTASPGANKVYGTDGSGVKGWKADPIGGGGGDMVKSTYDTGNNGVVDTADAIAWAAVTGKPSTFAPSAHTHAASEISDSTAAGRAILTAANSAAQLSAIGAAAASHTHAASDISSGTIATARLGSGTANSTTFLRGDGSWATPAGGSFDTNAATAVSGAWTFTGPVSFAGSGSAEIDLYDADQDHWVTFAPASTTLENYRLMLPAAAPVTTGFLSGNQTGTNVSLSWLAFGTGGGDVAQGNDSRIVNAVQTSRTVTGANSISGGGSLAADRTLALVNDSATPGANKVYGTDGSGVKGWKNDPSGGGGGGSTTNYATGSDVFRTSLGNYALRMGTTDGGFEWAPFSESQMTKFRSSFFGGSATIAQCGNGESWTATGTLAIQDGTAGTPLHNFVAATSTIGTDVGINGNGFKRWKPGTGIKQSAMVAMSNTNSARYWAGLTSAAMSTMDTNAPDAKFAGFHYEPSNTPNTWRFSTSNGGGTFTETDTGIAPSPESFQSLWISEGSGAWYGWINGTCVATNSANLPTTVMQPSFSLHTVTSTATTNRFVNIETVGSTY